MEVNIAVTGGTGFIGRHLIRKLISEGYAVKCLVREESKIAFPKSQGIEQVRGDILNKESLIKLVEGTEAVFHLAGIVSVSSAIKDPVGVFMVNTLGTLNLVEALRLSKNNNCFVIYLSSDRVYAGTSAEKVDESCPTKPVDPYGASKLCAEYLCQVYNKTYNVPFVILRGATVYGAKQKSDLFIPSLIQKLIASEEEIKVGNLEVHRSFIYVQDMINALHLAFLQRERASGEMFNIAERTVRVKKVAELLSNLSLKYIGKMPRLVQSPSLLRRFELPNRKYELICSKALDNLGWVPQFPLEEGLDKTFKSFWEAENV